MDLFRIFILFLVYLSCSFLTVSAYASSENQETIEHLYLRVTTQTNLKFTEQEEIWETISYKLADKPYTPLKALAHYQLALYATKDHKLDLVDDILALFTIMKNEQAADNGSLHFYHHFMLLAKHSVLKNNVEAIKIGKQMEVSLAQLTITKKERILDKRLFVNEDDIAKFYLYLGEIYANTAQYSLAHQHFKTALIIFSNNQNIRGQISTFNHLSTIAEAQANYLKAIDFLEEAKALINIDNDSFALMVNQLNRANNYTHMKRFESARMLLENLLKHSDIKQHQKLHIHVLLAYADFLKDRNFIEEAKYRIQEADAIAGKLNNAYHQIQVDLALGNLLALEGDFNEGIRLLKTVLNYYRSKGLITEEKITHDYLQKAYRQANNFEQALYHLERFQMLDSQLNEKTHESSLIYQQTEFESEKHLQKIDFLKKENQLKAAQLAVIDKENTYNIVISLCVALILFLWLGRYYQKRQTNKFKHLNEGIRARESHLKLLSTAFENTSDGVWITNTSLEIEVVNDAYSIHTGYQIAEVQGTKLSLPNGTTQPENTLKKIIQAVKLDHYWQGEVFAQAKDKRVFSIELEVKAVLDDDNQIIHYLGIFRDISEKIKAQAAIAKHVTHDKVTGLPNRQLFAELLHHSVLNSIKTSAIPVVLSITVNELKSLIENAGHDFGDQVLTSVGQRIIESLYRTDVVARTGNSEFVVLIESKEPKYGAGIVAKKLLSLFERAFEVNDTSINLSAAIGIALYPIDGDQPEELLRKASIAMFGIQESQRRGYRFFEKHMNTEVGEELAKQQNLLRAIDNRLFEFFYQPLVNAKTGCISGAEALIRWREPDGSLIFPDQFIPFAEKSGLIEHIDVIAIEDIANQISIWQQQNCLPGPVSINLSAQIFSQQEKLLTILEGVLLRYGISAKTIKLEITEGMLLTDIDKAIETMIKIKQLGFKLALDDFGTGFSSLSYLKKFPIDILKIDRSFIMDMHESDVDKSIVRSIIDLAHNLNLTVVGEGVEIDQHLDELQKMKCEEYQGYLYSKPLCKSEFESLLSNEVKIVFSQKSQQ